MRKTQYFQVEFKSVEVKEEGGVLTIEGFASTPDLDSYDDIVKPSAFQNTMGSYMQKPIILLQHNMDKIIGKAVDYRIEENGLYIKVEIFNDIDGTMKNIQEGLLGAFSIGFRALKWEIREMDDRWIREITELRLVEVSVVAFPANVQARFSIAKSVKSFFDSLAEIKSFGA
jgi:HK97 family phage prohead protease